MQDDGMVVRQTFSENLDNLFEMSFPFLLNLADDGHSFSTVDLRRKSGGSSRFDGDMAVF
ncbi:hypothetical protein G6L97_26560 (plasmid) [Agrobacterium tumefaciens]|nr:hypothetical protein [Agrobacterium tumefaciens]WCA72886.1 hypothetical protein G6L97_26560 [Agrobacterium tumefaciens]